MGFILKELLTLSELSGDFLENLLRSLPLLCLTHNLPSMKAVSLIYAKHLLENV